MNVSKPSKRILTIMLVLSILVSMASSLTFSAFAEEGSGASLPADNMWVDENGDAIGGGSSEEAQSALGGDSMWVDENGDEIGGGSAEAAQALLEGDSMLVDENGNPIGSEEEAAVELEAGSPINFTVEFYWLKSDPLMPGVQENPALDNSYDFLYVPFDPANYEMMASYDQYGVVYPRTITGTINDPAFYATDDQVRNIGNDQLRYIINKDAANNGQGKPYVDSQFNNKPRGESKVGDVLDTSWWVKQFIKKDKGRYLAYAGTDPYEYANKMIGIDGIDDSANFVLSGIEKNNVLKIYVNRVRASYWVGYSWVSQNWNGQGKVNAEQSNPNGGGNQGCEVARIGDILTSYPEVDTERHFLYTINYSETSNKSKYWETAEHMFLNNFGTPQGPGNVSPMNKIDIPEPKSVPFPNVLHSGYEGPFGVILSSWGYVVEYYKWDGVSALPTNNPDYSYGAGTYKNAKVDWNSDTSGIPGFNNWEYRSGWSTSGGATAASSGQLVINADPKQNNIVRLYYVGPPPEVKVETASFRVDRYVKDKNGDYKFYDTVDSGDAEVGTEISADGRDYIIDGYKYDGSDPENGTIVVKEGGDNVIKLLFSVKRVPYTFKYVLRNPDGSLNDPFLTKADEGDEGDVIKGEDGKLPDKEIPEGYEYEVCDPDELTLVDGGDNDIVIIYKPKDVPFTVKHFLINAVTALPIEQKNDEFNGTGKFGTDVSYNGYVKSYAGYVFKEAIPESITLKIQGNVIEIYYAPGATSYTIKHILRTVDGDVTAEEETKGGEFGAEVTTQDKAKEDGYFEGYTFVEANPEDKIVLGEGENAIELYYDPVHVSFVVRHHLLNLTIGDYVEQTADRQSVTGKYGQIISYAGYVKTSYENYTFKSVDNETIVLDAEGKEINIYYDPENVDYTVNHYLNVGGNGYVLEKTDNKTGAFGAVITAKENIEKFANYTFKYSDVASITLNKNGLEINLYYDPDGVVYDVEHYFLIDGEEVFADAQRNISGVFGETITSSTKQKVFVGYTYNSADPEALTLAAEGNLIKLYYVPVDVTYDVVHVLRAVGGNVVAAEEKGVSGKFGQVVSAAGFVRDDFTGYTFIEADPAELTLSLAGNLITLYYDPVAVVYDIQHIIKTVDGDKVELEELGLPGTFGETIVSSTKQKTFTGYTYDGADPEKLVLAVEGNLIKLYYVPVSIQYTVEHYKFDGSGYVLADTDGPVSGKYGQTVYADAQVRKFYTGFNYDHYEAEAIVLDGADDVIRLYYNPIEVNFTVEHYTLNKVTAQWILTGAAEKYTGTFGDVITSADFIKNPVFNGFKYDHVEKETITLKVEGNVVRIYYVPDAVVFTVQHWTKDLNGVYNMVKAEENIAGKDFGDVVVASNYKETFTGYTFVKADPEVLVLDVDNNLINLYYDPDGVELIVNHYLKVDGSYALEKTEKFGGTFGESVSYNFYVLSFKGFKFVSADPSVAFTLKESGNVINIYYDPNVVKAKVQHYKLVDGEYVLDSENEIDVIVDEEIISADQKKNIDGYGYVGADPDVLVPAEDGENLIKLYYDPEAVKFTVNHYKKNALGMYGLVQTEVKDGEFNQLIISSEHQIVINGYTYVGAEPESLRLKKEGNVIDLYYDPNAVVYTVKHYKKTVDGYVLAETVADVPGYVDQVIYGNDVKIVIDGYTFKKAVPDKLVLTEGENLIELFYDPNPVTLIVKHYKWNRDTGAYEFVEETEIPDVVFGQEIISSDYQNEYTGFNYNHADPETLVLAEDGNVVELFYNPKQVKLIIKHVKRVGGEEVLLDEEEIYVEYGETIVSEDKAKEYDDLEFKDADPDEIVIGEKDEEITLYYEPKVITYDVEHYKYNGKEYKLADFEKDVAGEYGDVIVSRKLANDYKGFALVNVNMEELKLVVSGEVIKLYYDPTKVSFKVEHYKLADGEYVKVEDDTREIGGVVGDTVVAEDYQNEYDGFAYQYATPDELTLTEDGENVLKLYYDPIMVDYTINFWLWERVGDNVMEIAKMAAAATSASPIPPNAFAASSNVIAAASSLLENNAGGKYVKVDSITGRGKLNDIILAFDFENRYEDLGYTYVEAFNYTNEAPAVDNMTLVLDFDKDILNIRYVPLAPPTPDPDPVELTVKYFKLDAETEEWVQIGDTKTETKLDGDVVFTNDYMLSKDEITALEIKDFKFDKVTDLNGDKVNSIVLSVDGDNTLLYYYQPKPEKTTPKTTTWIIEYYTIDESSNDGSRAVNYIDSESGSGKVGDAKRWVGNLSQLPVASRNQIAGKGYKFNSVDPKSASIVLEENAENNIIRVYYSKQSEGGGGGFGGFVNTVAEIIRPRRLPNTGDGEILAIGICFLLSFLLLAVGTPIFVAKSRKKRKSNV